MAKYGSRGYSMKMASMRSVYRNKPGRRAMVKALRKAFKQRRK